MPCYVPQTRCSGSAKAGPVRRAIAPDDLYGRAATEMRALIDTLRSDHESAHALLLRAERSGVEVSQAQFDLNSAFDALVKARAAVHAFTVAAVTAPVAEGRTIVGSGARPGSSRPGRTPVPPPRPRRVGAHHSHAHCCTGYEDSTDRAASGTSRFGDAFGRPPCALRSLATSILDPGRRFPSADAAWWIGCSERVSALFCCPCCTHRAVPRAACLGGIERRERDAADQGQ